MQVIEYLDIVQNVIFDNKYGDSSKLHYLISSEIVNDINNKSCPIKVNSNKIEHYHALFLLLCLGLTLC